MLTVRRMHSMPTTAMLLNMKDEYKNPFSWMCNLYIDYAMNLKIWRIDWGWWLIILLIILETVRGVGFLLMTLSLVRKLNVRRKNKDYVYGIWVYKALGIWKGYYRVKKITGPLEPDGPLDCGAHSFDLVMIKYLPILFRFKSFWNEI